MRDDLDRALSYASDVESWAAEHGDTETETLLAAATLGLRQAISRFEPPEDGPEILGRQGGMYFYA